MLNDRQEYHVIMLHNAQWTTNYFARASILIGLQFGHVIEQRSNQNNRSDAMRIADEPIKRQEHSQQGCKLNFRPVYLFKARYV